MLAANPAVAACVVTPLPLPNTVTCTATTTTNNTTDTNGVPKAPPDREYLFTTGGFTPGGKVTGTVASGATVNGFGLAIVNISPGAADINFTNAGTITLTTGVPTAGGFAALNLTSPGNITYLGNGNVSSGGFNAGAVVLSAGGGISFGTLASPITGTFVGLGGISAEAENIGIFLSGGSVTATAPAGEPISADAIGLLTIQTINQTTIAGQPGSVGILASAGGNITVTTDANIGTSAAGLFKGIQADSFEGGTVTVTQTGGTIFGTLATGSTGIFASTVGDIFVATSAGSSIDNAAFGIQAIVNPKGTGNIKIQADGVINATNTGILATNEGNGGINIFNGGTVNASAGGNGITALAASGNVVVSNSGTVNATGDAIFAQTTGNVTVSNSGLLTGAMSLSGATNTFNNNGTWNATGNSSFVGPSIVNNNGNGVINISGPAGITLGATSTFNNSGTINASSSPAGSPTITAANFNNSGLINLATGTATNQLTLFGNFTGLRGSTLGISVNPSSGSADQLIIKGTASGTTSVFANYLGPLKFVTTPIPVVTASPVSTATFSLLDPNNGPLMYSLNQSGGLYSLVSSGLSPTGTFIATATPAAVAATQLTITGIETQLRQRRDQIQCHSSSGITSACNAAHAMSYQDVVSNYQQENTKQDPATNAIAVAVKAPPAPPAVQDLGPKPGVWVQAFDDWQRLDQSIASGNAGTKQNTYGFQGGFDETWRNLLGSGDALVLGLVGGYTQASVHYDACTTKASLSGPGFGGYWTYINGGFSTDGVVKNDWFHLTDDVFQTVFQTGQSSSANVQNFSVTGNAQYKFAVLTNSFIEPTAGFVYTQTSYSDVPATLDTLVNGHTTRVQGGARFGTAWDYNGIHFEPTLLGLVYDNVQVTGTPLQSIGVVVPTDEGKVRGEFDLVLNADFGKGFSGFAEGDVRFGDNLLGGTVKAGLRKQW